MEDSVTACRCQSATLRTRPVAPAARATNAAPRAYSATKPPSASTSATAAKVSAVVLDRRIARIIAVVCATVSSSLSTDPRAPARARSRVPSRHVSNTGTSTRAPCTELSRGKRCAIGLIFTDEASVAAIAERLQLEIGDGVTRVDGEDVAEAIRTSEIDAASAAVARQPRVREVLNAQQRELGKHGKRRHRGARHRDRRVSGC